MQRTMECFNESTALQILQEELGTCLSIIVGHMVVMSCCVLGCACVQACDERKPGQHCTVASGH